MFTLLKITLDENQVLNSFSEIQDIPLDSQTILDLLVSHLEECPYSVTQSIRFLELAEFLIDTDPSLTTRLPSRTVAALPANGKKRVKLPPQEYQDLHPELTQELVLWRRAKAKEQNVPAYFILHQRVLFSIADNAPRTEEELLSIPGFGPKLMSRWGEDILSIVAKTLRP